MPTGRALTPTTRRRLTGWVGALLRAADCGGAGTPATTAPASAQVITHKGSDTMVNLALAWAEAYAVVAPLDELTSGLDPISTAKVEASLQEIKQTDSVVIMPHSVPPAARIADRAAFFLQGELVEVGPGHTLFVATQDKRTEDYVTGRFG